MTGHHPDERIEEICARWQKIGPGQSTTDIDYLLTVVYRLEGYVARLEQQIGKARRALGNENP